MRTNIDIDDDLLAAAMKSGPFKTKKDAVEAGLRLVARQAAYREILRWEGKLHWDGDADDTVTPPLTTGGAAVARTPRVQEPAPRPKAKGRHAGG
jgi:Arc/MetJ family transcription regulator